MLLIGPRIPAYRTPGTRACVVAFATLLTAFVVACGSGNGHPDGSSDAPLACTPDPATIATHRACVVDDTCPCGAHCELGQCVAQCGAGMASCASGSYCDSFGRCRVDADNSTIRPIVTSASGTVVLDAPRATLPDLGSTVAVRFHAQGQDLGPMRLAIAAPFEIQCSDGAPFGAECRDPGLAPGAERVVHVHVAAGTTSAPTTPGILRIYWGANVETMAISAATSNPTPPALQGSYTGTATLIDVAVTGNGASGRHIAAPSSFTVPLTAQVFAPAGGHGVIVLGDRFRVFGTDNTWVGSLAVGSAGGTVTLPRHVFSSGSAATGIEAPLTLGATAAAPFAFTSAQGPGVVAFTLTTTVDGLFEGGATSQSHWRFAFTRTGDLPAGTSAPAVPPDAPAPASGRAAMATPWSTALTQSFTAWNGSTSRTTAEYDDLLATGGDVAASVDPRRRLDACQTGIEVPAAYWDQKSDTAWTPTRNFAGPTVPVTSTLLTSYTTGANSLFGVLLHPVDPSWSVNSFSAGAAGFHIDTAIPCAVDFGTRDANACIPGAETYGVIDRCAEFAAAIGCTPAAAPAGTTGVTFTGSMSLTDDGGHTCSAPSVALTGTVQRVCVLAAPATGQCAEMLACTSGLNAGGHAASDPATGDLGYAFAPTLPATSISGDLACAGGARSAATPADATRDAHVMQAASAVIAACVADLAVLGRPVPTVAMASNGTGLVQLFQSTSGMPPACIDAARTIVALEWASDADRARALGNTTRAVDARGTRLEHRLLQQWLQVHTLIATEAGQRIVVPDAVRGTAPMDDVPAPVPALADSLAAWNLLFNPRFGTPLAAMSGTVLDQPDYRAPYVAALPFNANHPQPQGLPLAMVDALRAQLALLQQLIGNAALASDNSVFDSATAPTGTTMRATLAMLPLIEELHVRANAAAVARGARATSWDTQFASSENALRGQIGQVLAAAHDFAQGHNPLGIEDSDLPLYFFGNSADPSVRFSAVSDYLLGSSASASGWAVAVVNEARTAATAVGAAYQTQSQRLYEQSLSDADIASRLDGIRAQFGNQVSSLCGTPGTLATNDVLEHWADQAGRPFSGANCYLRLEEPACRVNTSALNAQLSRDDVLYQLCVAQQVNLTAANGISFPDPGLTQLSDPSQDLSTCGAIGPCTMPGANSLCITCGIVTAQVSASALAMGTSLTAVDPGVIDQARQACRVTYPNAHERPPSSNDSANDPYATGACYRGSLGELAMTVRAAAVDVQIARADYAAHTDAYDIAMQSCLIREQGNAMLEQIQTEHDQEMHNLRIGKLTADIAAETAEGAKDCFDAVGDVSEDITGGAIGVCVSAGVEAAAKSTSDGLEFAMQESEDEHNALVMMVTDQTDFAQCVNDASMQLVGAQSDSLRIERAMQDLQLAVYRLNQGILGAQGSFDDGNATLQAAENRTVRPPDLDPWIDQTVTAFQASMHRARRFTYLAERAVEYEYQTSMSARASVLAAQTPDQLQAVINGLLDFTRTNRVNGNSPSNLEVVLSLRQHLLQLQDRSHAPAGEQALSDIQRFRLLLEDPRYAVFDASGAYQGQQVPFSLVPLGSVNLSANTMGIPVFAAQDCAERIWSVNASVLGNATTLVRGDQSTFTRMDLLKSNTFYSQWCSAPAAGQPAFQQASVRPSVNLFRDPEFGITMIGSSSIGGDVGVSNETQNFTRARIQPRLNVPRAEFEGDMYANGQTSELAARGLYGEYALFVPAAVLSRLQPDGTYSNGLNLDAIDDILIRIDYVSVAR